MRLIKESSERSENINKVKRLMIDSGLCLISLEGYTIKNYKVSAIFERYLVQDCAPEDCDKYELFEKIVSIESEGNWKNKINLSNVLEVPFFIVIYSYPLRKVAVFRFINSELRHEKIFNSINDFSDWCYTFRDMIMTSPYQESNLPIFDKELRKIGKPWPGNLDCVWYEESKIIALIEFQTTIKTSVREHCNNNFFLTTPYRKGDENRWRVLDVIRRQIVKPLIIIVWSPNESDVKIKVVDHITFSQQGSNEKPGLYYSRKDVIPMTDIVGYLKVFDL